MPISSQTRVVLLDENKYQGTKIVDRLNWTGKVIAFPRSEWLEIRNRSEFNRSGVYMLISKRYSNDELPALYVGRGDCIATRIDEHYKKKEFWDTAVCFVSKCNDLNCAHTAWLEFTFIQYAYRCGHSIKNVNFPRKPTLDEFDCLNMERFFQEILLLLPHSGFDSLTVELPLVSLEPHSIAAAAFTKSSKADTVIVSIEPELTRISLAQNCLIDLKLDEFMLDNLSYVALHQTNLSSITHIAPIEIIEPFGRRASRCGVKTQMKYNLIFSESALKISPIPFGNIRSSRSHARIEYTSLNKLKKGASQFSRLSQN